MKRENDISNKRSVIRIGVLLLSLLPLRHVLLNQPGIGIYYNELAGGIHNTFGKYPTDEGRNFNRKASKWLISYIHKNDPRFYADTLPKLQVATMDVDATRHYFRYETSRIEVVEAALADTTCTWDYYLSYIDDINPRKLKRYWDRQEEIIKTYKTDSKPVAVILRTLPDTIPAQCDTLAIDSIALSQNKVIN